MGYTVAVTLVARPGAEARLEEILRTLEPLTRAEPGCVHYYVHRSCDDPRRFFVYEQYVDEAAFQADQRSEHFQAYVLREALPLLESSERDVYDLLRPASV